MNASEILLAMPVNVKDGMLAKINHVEEGHATFK